MIEWIKNRSRQGTIRGILSSFVFLMLLNAFIPVGRFLAWIHFTSLPTVPHQKIPGWALPIGFFVLLAAMWGWEIFFRGFILRFFLKRFSWQQALLLHTVVLNIILIPLLWQTGAAMKEMGMVRFFLGENLFELFLALFFLNTGSILAVTFLHGLCNFIRFLMVSDAGGPFPTRYFYVADSDAFYWLYLAMGLGMVVLQLWINRKRGMEELIPSL